MYFVTTQPKSKRYGSIMVFIDRNSKYVTFIATPTDCKANEDTHLFINHINEVVGGSKEYHE